MNRPDSLTCPHCGKPNPPGNIFCGDCGSRLHTPSKTGLQALSMDDLTEKNFLEQALEGRFEIEQELGRGGFGVVFRAKDLQLDRLVAIKALHLTKSGDPMLVKRFIPDYSIPGKQQKGL